MNVISKVPFGRRDDKIVLSDTALTYNDFLILFIVSIQDPFYFVVLASPYDLYIVFVLFSIAVISSCGVSTRENLWVN